MKFRSPDQAAYVRSHQFERQESSILNKKGDKTKSQEKICRKIVQNELIITLHSSTVLLKILAEI